MGGNLVVVLFLWGAEVHGFLAHVCKGSVRGLSNDLEVPATVELLRPPQVFGKPIAALIPCVDLSADAKDEHVRLRQHPPFVFPQFQERIQ